MSNLNDPLDLQNSVRGRILPRPRHSTHSTHESNNANLNKRQELPSRSHNVFPERNPRQNTTNSRPWEQSTSNTQSINKGPDGRLGAIRKNRSQSSSSASYGGLTNQLSKMTIGNRNSQPARHGRNYNQELNNRAGGPRPESHGRNYNQELNNRAGGPRPESRTRNRGRNMVHSLDRKSLLGGRTSYEDNLHPKENVNSRKASNRIPRRMEWMIEYSDKPASDIVAKLANSHSGFEAVLKDGQLLKEMPHVLVLIVKMLAKVGDADFKENKISVLAKACSLEFIEQLSSFTNFLPTEKTKNEKLDVNDFLNDILLFSKSVTTLLPNTAMERFGRVVFSVNACITGMEEYCHVVIKDDLKQLAQEIKTLLTDTSENKDTKVKVTSTSELMSFQAPPNNFRDINLIPTVDDIFTEEVAFVRPNLIKGAYSNIEHYLDVQFRLLHEDFLCPMREGIREYVQRTGRQNMKRRITNVRLYKKVIFLGPKIVTDRIGIIVNFDPDRRLKRMNWRSSKRFMYGSLLCFTQDNFRSIMFGTVVERDARDLQQGMVIVELCIGSQIRDDLFRAQFTMAESEVYFEPYYQVLKALKEMNEEEFPMKQYIVDAKCDGRPPGYLMTDKLARYSVESKFTYPVLVSESWPSAKQLGLDDSQYRAFKFALTKEFVVIQGPPGTGKTFLGLKIAGVLLENHRVWNSDRKPILVVCYTNHALDQFLEGLLKHTKKIVRVGSRSKSEVLEQFNLKNLRRDYKRGGKMWNEKEEDADDDREVNEDEVEYIQKLFSRMISTHNLGRDIRERMEESMYKIKRIQLDLEMIQKKEGIISLNDLHEQGAISPHIYVQFPGDEVTKEENFREWLLSRSEFAFYNQDNEVMEENEDEDMEENFTEDTKERFARDIREDYDLRIRDVQSRLKYATSLQHLRQQQYGIKESMKYLRNSNDEMQFCSEMPYLEFELDDSVYKTERLQQRLKENKIMNNEDMQRLSNQIDITKLSFNDRWMLYRSWISKLKEKLLEGFKELEGVFSSDAKKYEEVRYMIDLEIMKNSHVIGMTTTCAARYQTLLKALKPKIVIVEEAAEVLESHIIVSLTSHCQHLILIGDHQQLRPSTSVYKLAKEFSLDVSLFERMLNNDIHCEVLKVQHRMRPEIASLIVPAIYPELRNHKDVTVFDQIQGVTKNLFFIDHTFPDEQVGDNFSRRNVHEADFLVTLCRHLIMQGYEANSITILATYTAQMFYMKNESKKYDLLQNVTITVVDNFQGEENDIILLSLVRSNEEDNIGFLKIENRVCVALSRARKGLYIMGNMKNLVSSDIWQKIKSTLVQLKSVGLSLELQCKVHPYERRLVSKAEDLTDIPEGGCKLPCGSLLGCGHTCQSVCHASDREHSKYRCSVDPCDRVMCILGHKCKKICFEECGPCFVPVMRTLRCGHQHELMCHIDYEKIQCQVPVKKLIPDCNHNVEMACSTDPSKFPCTKPCDARLDECGHTCRRECHVNKDPDHLDYKCMQECPRTNAKCSENHPCMKRCYEKCGLCQFEVKKKLPNCRHKAMMTCSQDPETYECQDKCDRTMECGHKCKRKCGERCNNCNAVVIKSIPGCEHTIKLKCCTPAEQKMCQKPCARILSCGHKCTASCGVDCIKKCMKMVASEVQAECGHEVEIPCYKKKLALPSNSEELLSYCRAKCGTQLQCGHTCPGTCSECFQGRLHVSCQQKCGRILICGHQCDTPCAVTCPPCRKKCTMRCSHNKCKQTCGQPCTPCQEMCLWKCVHLRCTKKCGDICNRPPCPEPCRKLIEKCGHPCIGFCGEPCPKLCLICDKKEVTTIMFGNEDEEDARFVLLEDCNHIVEHRDLEHWLTVEHDGAVTMAVCPRCKTPISRNVRYSNIVKQRYAAVCEVKRMVFGKRDSINNSRNEHFQKLKAVQHVYLSQKEDIAARPTIMPLIRRPRLAQTQPAKTATYTSILRESVHFGKTMEMLLDQVNLKNKKNRKNVHSNIDMETLGIKAEVLRQMGMKVTKHQKHLALDAKKKVLQRMDGILAIIRYRDKILSSQEVADLDLEVQRFHRIVDMYILESTPFYSHLNPEDKTMFEEQLRKPLMSIAKYSLDLDSTLKEVQSKLSKVLRSMQIITEEERRQIVKAVGMRPGHWFKCPKGHFYIIGECGGANQVAHCNECGSRIGGSNHTLLSGNQHAPEMDGSTFAAWSEAANLANYAFGWNRWW